MLNERAVVSPVKFTHYPLLWLAVCFMCGILLAKIADVDWQIYLLVCLTFATCAAVFRNRSFAPHLIFVAFVAVGGLYFQIENQSAADNRVKFLYDGGRIISGEPLEITGVVQSKPELAAGGFFLELQTERAIYKNERFEASGKIRLFAPVRDEQTRLEYERLNLQYGSIINVACRLRREERFLNPGGVSAKEIFDQKDIDATATVKSPLLIEKIGDAPRFAALGWLYDLREDLIVEFRDNFNVSTAGVLIASLLGNRYFLDAPTADVFRDGGTFHVLVISGLHITFIGGLVLLFVRVFTRSHLWQFAIANAFLWAFALAVGAEVPVVRAAVMFTILLFPRVIYRRGTLLNSLGGCALLLLAWRPHDLFAQSFQLTFASVGALVALAFPLIEKLRAIGVWAPSAETPVPPRISFGLKRFCETLYWREEIWQIESARHIWTANLFKNPYIKWKRHSRLQTLLRYVFESILVSLVVQLCLLPLSIIYFHRVSLAGVFLNLWVGVVLALETFAAVFAVILGQISRTFAFPFVKITEFFNWLLTAFPRFFVENSWTSFRVPHYSGAGRFIYFSYFVLILAIAFLLYDWNPLALNFNGHAAKIKSKIFRNLTVVSLILIGLMIFHPFSALTLDGRLRIDFLDVGQGDSALLTFPNGETMLVDGGGRNDYNSQLVERDGEVPELFEPDTQSVGETVVSNFLWAKGYARVDYILATHSDADHIEGLADVAKNFAARGALFGGTPFENKNFAAVYAILQKRGVPISVLSRGDSMNFGGVKVEVLHPEKSVSPEASSDNNRSLVLRLIYGTRKILLTGDIEKEAEKELLNFPEFLDADVIKVAHHGSRTSSTAEFIGATRAKLAVISVGRKSQFGHPHREVVERWRASGARVLTTGERGTVSVSTDGTDLRLETFKR